MENKKIEQNTNFKAPQPLDVRLKDVSYKVCLRNGQELEILHNMNMYFKPGEVTGILGPVGAGKTSILNVISKRVQTGVKGQVLINNIHLQKKHRKLMGYVLQRDYFFGDLIVYDTLLYTAQLRRGDLNSTQKQQLVHEIIQLLRLQNASKTRIGDPFNHGVSGGELKRVNIATELLSNPSICVLDEPTSGLDSSSAIAILDTLQQLAYKFSINVILSIHQPSSQAFAMLDKAIVICNGHLLYQGPGCDLLNYLTFIGYRTPPGWNVSDYVMELMTDIPTLENMKTQYKKFITRNVGGNYYMGIGEYVGKSMLVGVSSNGMLEYEGIEKEKGGKIGKEEEEEEGKKEVESRKLVPEIVVEGHEYIDNVQINNFTPPSWPSSFYTLFKRGLKKDTKGETPFYTFTQTILLAFIVGVIWFKNMANYSEDTFVDRTGMIFFVTTYWMFVPGFIALISFLNERAIIAKERSSKSFGISSYMFAKMFSDIAIYSLTPTIFLIIAMPLTGIPITINQIAGFWGSAMITLFVSHSIGSGIAAMFTKYESSSLVFTIFSLVCMLTGGFFVAYQNVPFWLKWIRYISLVNYAVSISTYANFNGYYFQCSPNTNWPKCPMPGSELMADTVTGFGPFLDICCMLLIWSAAKLVSYVFLRFGKQLKMV